MKKAIEQKIVIEPFGYCQLLKLTMHKQVNEHSQAEFCLLIDEEKEDEYWRLAADDLLVEIKQIAHSTETVLMKGILQELQIQAENGVKELHGVIYSTSCLMDLVPHLRTFQDSSLTYKEIIDTLMSGYADRHGICLMRTEDRAIQNFILQYRETDWTFAKRMASCLGTCLFPYDVADGIQISCGLSTGEVNKAKAIATKYYTVRKALSEYRFKKGHQVNVYEPDIEEYQVTAQEILDLGDCLQVNGQQLYVYAIHAELRGSELSYRYRLRHPKGFMQARKYNSDCAGVSLKASILVPAKDVVQVAVEADENPATKPRWFPYSTVYSSPDGTGWYCMPEPGDAVRLYMPSADEKEAYVISSVHLQTSNHEERQNPDNKSLMNKYGKEVLMTPDSLTFTNNQGMSVSIRDGEGISIVSNAKIDIVAQDNLTLSSETGEICVDAPEEIKITQNGTAINLKDDIKITGAEVHVQ